MATPLDDLLGDIIDTRDLIARFEELEQDAADEDEDVTLDDEERAELEELRAICEEGESSFADWPYGETLVAEDHFEDYARELAEEIGAVDRDAAWPNAYIDWTAAANALQQDYTSITIRGTEYYGR